MKEKFRMIHSTLKVAWELDSLLIILCVAHSVIVAIRPYIPIIFAAYAIDGLLSGRPFMELIIIGAIAYGTDFLLASAQEYMRMIRDARNQTCILDFKMKHAVKTLDMDFELLESPEVNALRTKINTDLQWGAGFASVVWQLPQLLERFINLIISFIILFPLFLSGGFFQSIYSPLFFVAAIVIAILGAKSNEYFEGNWMVLLDELQGEENKSKYGYFMNMYWGNGMNYRKGKDTRVYNAGKLIKEYSELGKDYDRDWSMRVTKNSSKQAFVSGISAGIIWAGAYLFVTLRAIAGAISIGSVLIYANALKNFAQGLTDCANTFSTFVTTAKRQQGILEYMAYPDVLYKGTLPVEKRRDNEYEIEFKNVSFKYPGSDEYALKNLNLKLNIGQRLAVVGMNGSGKTTMIKLLCRLYDPTEGEITLNGYDIKKYDYVEYMRVFSVVFQDFKLFSFPLGQNVAIEKEYDPKRVRECLESAGLSERYSNMKNGLDTPLYSDYEEGGIEISGGEAQKIALARALYKDAPFVVLDEPTAALDPIAEFEVYSRFNEIVGNKTAVYISHRLSSCRFCDDIAVFHEGELIQRGSHDILISDENGKYNELWNAQAQYYTEPA